MKIQQLLVFIAATNLSFTSKLANAVPIQCYIGRDGSYQICDMQRKGKSYYSILWPSGNRTVFDYVLTQSGEYIEVSHFYSDGKVYGRGTRYPRMHYEHGEWLCLHTQPGGRGKIDFCIRK